MIGKQAVPRRAAAPLQETQVLKLKCYSVGDIDTRSSAADATGVRPRMNRLYQTSTMAALLDAVYDGETTLD